MAVMVCGASLPKSRLSESRRTGDENGTHQAKRMAIPPSPRRSRDNDLFRSVRRHREVTGDFA